MSNASVSPVAARVRTRVRAGVAALSVAVVVAGGVTAHHVSQPSEPTQEAMGRAIPTPCDGFADCIYTAYWYAFLR
jgi:hypothetical protein